MNDENEDVAAALAAWRNWARVLMGIPEHCQYIDANGCPSYYGDDELIEAIETHIASLELRADADEDGVPPDVIDVGIVEPGVAALPEPKR